MHIDKYLYFRILLIVVLLAGTGYLYYFFHARETVSTRNITRNPAGAASEIDRQVDTVLAHFGIAPEWIRKKSVQVAGSEFQRVERRVLIPMNVPPIQVNMAFNALARKYGGRAIGSENTKENTVTIHLDLNGTVLQSIILKPARELPETAQRPVQKKSV